MGAGLGESAGLLGPHAVDLPSSYSALGASPCGNLPFLERAMIVSSSRQTSRVRSVLDARSASGLGRCAWL